MCAVAVVKGWMRMGLSWGWGLGGMGWERRGGRGSRIGVNGV